jgi:hypothetical protein
MVLQAGTLYISSGWGVLKVSSGIVSTVNSSAQVGLICFDSAGTLYLGYGVPRGTR